jgi:hypothetical protein
MMEIQPVRICSKNVSKRCLFPKVIGNGSFGVVYQAKLCETGEMVAIKKVLQDKRFKNRELQVNALFSLYD